LLGTIPSFGKDGLREKMEVTIKMRKPVSNDVIGDAFKRLGLHGGLNFLGSTVEFTGSAETARKLRAALEQEFGRDAIFIWRETARKEARSGRPPSITITGRTGIERLVPWNPDLTLTFALRSAEEVGWQTFEKAVIVRKGERLTFKMESILKGKIRDPRLQSGDALEIR